MSFLVFLLGFVFGMILLQAKLQRFNAICGMATLVDFTFAKAILLAVGIGLLLFSFEIAMGMASFNIKPFVAGDLVFGGLIFGAGMAILGYSPETLPVSLGEGSLDALAGITGAIAGGFAFYFVSPEMQSLMGESWGELSLFTLIGKFNALYFVVLGVLAVLLILFAFRLNRIEKSTNRHWIFAGAGLAVLNSIMIMNLTLGEPVDTADILPYVAGLVSGNTDAFWFESINPSGKWQLVFFSGAMLAGLVFSLIRREFKLKVVPERWAKYHGNSVPKRLVYAFIGGFMLLFGAGMANGSISGHFISGGMQVAFSSYVFAIFTIAGLLVTGKLFYRN